MPSTDFPDAERCPGLGDLGESIEATLKFHHDSLNLKLDAWYAQQEVWQWKVEKTLGSIGSMQQPRSPQPRQTADSPPPDLNPPQPRQVMVRPPSKEAKGMHVDICGTDGDKNSPEVAHPDEPPLLQEFADDDNADVCQLRSAGAAVPRPQSVPKLGWQEDGLFGTTPFFVDGTEHAIFNKCSTNTTDGPALPNVVDVAAPPAKRTSGPSGRPHQAPSRVSFAADASSEVKMVSTFSSGCRWSRRGAGRPPRGSMVSTFSSGGPPRVSMVSTFSSGACARRSVMSTPEDRALVKERRSRIDARLSLSSVPELNKEVLQEELEHADDDSDNHSNRKLSLKRLVASPHFDGMIALAIVTNAAFIGIQVQYTSGGSSQATPVEFHVIETLYWALFSVELVLRLFAERARFFYGSSCGWNFFDAALVLTSTLEFAVNVGSGFSDGDAEYDNLSMLRLIRILRVMRIMRIIRVMRFFKQLRILVTSILGILKSLVWALLLLMMIMYFFSIIFTQAAGEQLREGNAHEDLDDRFGSLWLSAYSLFMSVSGGEDWGQVAAPLADVHAIYFALFISYISFSIFALLNVMTGVFCQSAIESAEKDQDMVIQELLHSKRQTEEKLESLFGNRLGAGGEGELTISQFEAHLRDDKLRAWFASIDIDINDGWTLFKLLDTDYQGTVTVSEFVEGCLRLRGHAKKIDIAEMMHEHKRILAMIEQLVSDEIDNKASKLGVAPMASCSEIGMEGFRASKQTEQSSRSQVEEVDGEDDM